MTYCDVGALVKEDFGVIFKYLKHHVLDNM